MLELRHRALWLAGAWLIAATIVVGSLLPGPVVASVPTWDKGQHFVGYAVLAGWWLGILRPERYWLAVVLAIALGASVEVAQAVLTTTRMMDPADVLANALGAGAAWLAARLGLGGWAPAVERWLRVRPPRGRAGR